MASKGNSGGNGGSNRDWSPQDDYPIYLNSVISGSTQDRDYVNKNAVEIDSDIYRMTQRIDNLMKQLLQDYNYNSQRENYEVSPLRNINSQIEEQRKELGKLRNQTINLRTNLHRVSSSNAEISSRRRWGLSTQESEEDIESGLKYLVDDGNLSKFYEDYSSITSNVEDFRNSYPHR